MRRGLARIIVTAPPAADASRPGVTHAHFQDLGAARAWRRARAGLLGAAWLDRLRRAQSL